MKLFVNFLSYFLLFLCTHIHTEKNNLEAHYAGTWYPADPKKLTDLLLSLDQKAEQQFKMHTDNNKIRALIVPHAGYTYSGVVATAAYRVLKGSFFERIIIIGPAHTQPIHGIMAPKSNHYTIPSGTLTIDNDSINQLLTKNPLFQQSDVFFTKEHSIEAQLPLIHFFVPNATIIPLLIGTLSEKDIKDAALSLKEIITPKTLVIISTDLTHFGAQFDYMPFQDNLLLRVRQLDSLLLHDIQKNDSSSLKKHVAESGATICGLTPFYLLLEMIKQKTFNTPITRLVAYDTSVSTSKSTDSIVSYGSLIVTEETSSNDLNKQEKNSLLQYARTLLTHSFDKEIDTTLLTPLITPLLLKPHGVFVTLYKKNKNGKELRGCIGTVEPSKPLYQAVADMTLASAFNDTRFTPIKKQELQDITIEISVLTKPRPISSYKDIVLNKHGIILSHAGSSALFLPKVPQEHGFNLTQTLTELSKKAGLSENAWQLTDTQFQVFEALDFQEEPNHEIKN